MVMHACLWLCAYICDIAGSGYPDNSPRILVSWSCMICSNCCGNYTNHVIQATPSGGGPVLGCSIGSARAWPAASPDGERRTTMAAEATPVSVSRARGGYPGRGGGLWLWMTLPPGLLTWLVPSGNTVSVQPI
jgi:hypothetical protein